MKYIALLGLSLTMNTALLAQGSNMVSSIISFKESPVNMLNVALEEDATDPKVIVSSKQTSPQEIIKKLYAYLPSKIINDMNRFEMMEEKDGSITYIWYRLSNDNAYFIHNIQLTATKNDNKLLFYHYKDYFYDKTNLTPKNISKECASKMVIKFAKDFISSTEELRFVNKPSHFSLYDPGHVESWVAEGKEFNYVIMVDLDYGYIVYYRANNK